MPVMTLEIPMEIDAYWQYVPPAAGQFGFRELPNPAGGERRLGSPARIAGLDRLRDRFDEAARPENLQTRAL